MRLWTSVPLYSEWYERKFHAYQFSWAYFFTMTFFITTLILPLFMTFSTENFWVRSQTYFEQP